MMDRVCLFSEKNSDSYFYGNVSCVCSYYLQSPGGLSKHVPFETKRCTDSANLAITLWKKELWNFVSLFPFPTMFHLYRSCISWMNSTSEKEVRSQGKCVKIPSHWKTVESILLLVWTVVLWLGDWMIQLYKQQETTKAYWSFYVFFNKEELQ